MPAWLGNVLRSFRRKRESIFFSGRHGSALARGRAEYAAAIVPLVLLLAACGPQADTAGSAIPFAPLEDTTLHDPDNPTKVFRVDFARVEQEFPLSRADLMTLTPEILAKLPQEHIDQIYGRLTAGTIPDGVYEGSLFFPRGDTLKSRLSEIIGGIQGRAADSLTGGLEAAAQTLWKGKVFYRDQRVSRSLIDDLAPLASFIDNPATVKTAAIPRKSILRFIWPTSNAWLLFPAKVYCGQSLIDARRESVVIDYNFTDEVEGYRASPDSLAGRSGLQIREEIRMIRPGFYLGRAYAGHMFMLDFTLLNADVADNGAAAFVAGGPVGEDCWVGEQIRRTSARAPQK